MDGRLVVKQVMQWIFVLQRHWWLWPEQSCFQVCPSHSCECNLSRFWGNVLRFGPNVHLDSRMTWLDCGGQIQHHFCLTKHIFGHYPSIYMIIMTTFYTNVSKEQKMKRFYIQQIKSTGKQKQKMQGRNYYYFFTFCFPFFFHVLR